MPIRPEMRALYPADWPQLSRHVRHVVAGGRCQRCGRPHLQWVLHLHGGRWFDHGIGFWRDGGGRMIADPEPGDLAAARATYVVLACAHVDHAPQNIEPDNLRAWCQRCPLLHDAPRHRVQRWITVRLRYACGDLFLGLYRPDASWSGEAGAEPWSAHCKSSRSVATSRRLVNGLFSPCRGPRSPALRGHD